MVIFLYKKVLGGWRRLRSALYVLDLRLQGVKVGKGVSIKGRVTISGGENITIGDHVNIFDHVYLLSYSGGQIVVSDWASINRLSIIIAFNKVYLGRHVHIGPFCHVVDREHDFLHRGTTGSLMKPVIFEDRSGLGSGATVLKGVTIGHDTIVGARAVVTHDLPPGVFAEGLPARVLKEREGLEEAEEITREWERRKTASKT